MEQIERDHPRDVNRQKTEVIIRWQRNCRGATWSRLAEAVEKVGDHRLLVERLRRLGLECSPTDDAGTGGLSPNVSVEDQVGLVTIKIERGHVLPIQHNYTWLIASGWITTPHVFQ